MNRRHARSISEERQMHDFYTKCSTADGQQLTGRGPDTAGMVTAFAATQLDCSVYGEMGRQSEASSGAPHL